MAARVSLHVGDSVLLNRHAPVTGADVRITGVQPDVRAWTEVARKSEQRG